MARIIVPFAVLAGALMLAGCSFFFTNGVAGAYTATGAPLVGKLVAHNESGGRLLLGSVQKIECEGRYKDASRMGVKLLGVRIVHPIYKGQIDCRDGRQGHFELASGLHEHTGSIKGEIGGEAFTLKLIKEKNKDCTTEECRWGLKWNQSDEFFGFRSQPVLGGVRRTSGDL